jgi:hypothetical protein
MINDASQAIIDVFLPKPATHPLFSGPCAARVTLMLGSRALAVETGFGKTR